MTPMESFVTVVVAYFIILGTPSTSRRGGENELGVSYFDFYFILFDQSIRKRDGT